MLETLIIIVHIAASIAIIGLVLIQQGKGADAGAAFGSGASQTVFGSRGSASFLTRSTGILAAVFFVTSLSLAYLAGSSKSEVKSVTESVAVQPQGASDVPSAPGNAMAPASDVPSLPTSGEPAAPTDKPGEVPGDAVSAPASNASEAAPVSAPESSVAPVEAAPSAEPNAALEVKTESTATAESSAVSDAPVETAAEVKPAEQAPEPTTQGQ